MLSGFLLWRIAVVSALMAAGVFGIFGHGNVAGLGEALEASGLLGEGALLLGHGLGHALRHPFQHIPALCIALQADTQQCDSRQFGGVGLGGGDGPLRAG